MKIVQFIDSMADGGAETLVRDYAIMLTERGHQVAVFTRYPAPDTANTAFLREKGIQVRSIYGRRTFFTRGLNRFLGKRFIVPFAIKRMIKREHPQVLHVHMTLLGDVKAVGRSLKGIRLFYTCHSLPDRYFAGKNESEFFAAQYLIRENGLRLIALHNEMAKDLDRRFSVGNTAVIRNGIDFRRFSAPVESKAEIRESLGIPKDAFVLGHIGRFVGLKNHDFLVDVFATVAAREPEAFLLMVGNGVLRQTIEEKLRAWGLENRYLVLDHRTDVPRLLHAMDVFVFPSEAEGLGIALIEAQVAGLRCVVSDAVPEEAMKLATTVPLSLNEGSGRWADVVLDETACGIAREGLHNYDMNKEIERLEALYMGE